MKILTTTTLRTVVLDFFKQNSVDIHSFCLTLLRSGKMYLVSNDPYTDSVINKSGFFTTEELGHMKIRQIEIGGEIVNHTGNIKLCPFKVPPKNL